MCGIYGAIGCGLTADQGLAALRTLDHRGPDGRGFHHDASRDVFLGHTRLSIIDLSDAAAQPIFDEDDAVALTFNGEIYNYRELREEGLERGYRFQSIMGDIPFLLQSARSALESFRGHPKAKG